jgi:predicted O-methyltransferase YrrM
VPNTTELDAIRDIFRKDTLLTLVSPKTRKALEEMIDHPWFPGITDPSTLHALANLLRVIEPQKVLQLGTWIGFSALFMADHMASFSRPGHLVTVEPQQHVHEAARKWAKKAGLANRITFVDGYSTDPAVSATLHLHGPFDLIYLDSSHAYRETLQELDLIFGKDGWLQEDGLLLLHDASIHAMQWDRHGEGGVRRAMEEWVGERQASYQSFIFEPPLWPNGCGLGFITRRRSVEFSNLAIAPAPQPVQLLSTAEVARPVPAKPPARHWYRRMLGK